MRMSVEVAHQFDCLTGPAALVKNFTVVFTFAPAKPLFFAPSSSSGTIDGEEKSLAT